jgi:hypothetical protein
MALGQVFLRGLRFSPVSIIPPSFSILIFDPGMNISPLVAAVQRRRLTSSKSTVFCIGKLRVVRNEVVSVFLPEDKNSLNVTHVCRKRRLKGYPVPGCIAGSPCLRGSQIRRPGHPGLELGVGLTAPPCKTPVVRKSKEGYGP